MEITTTKLLERILCSDIKEINTIIDAAEERFQELFPEWELLVIRSKGHTPELHIQTLQHCIQLLSNTANDVFP